MVVPERKDLRQKLRKLDSRMKAALKRYVEEKNDELDELKARLKDPRRLLTAWQIHLDVLRDRLGKSFYHHRKYLYNELGRLELRFLHRNPLRRVEREKEKINNISTNLQEHFGRRLILLKERVLKNTAVLESLNPLRVLRRGYSITRRLTDNIIVRRADALRVGEDVKIQLARGCIDAKVRKISQE
jgi:exodeoxyribonuclease VII large subunit